MTRAAPVPFVPDQTAMPAATGKMLSEVIADLDAAPAAAMKTAHSPERGLARPLSNKEKWDLSKIAEKAYDFLKAAGRITPGQTLEMFRRAEAVKATDGKRISEAAAGDRKKIEAHFFALIGQARRAAQAAAQATNTARDIAMYKLREALRAGRKDEAYAGGIARRIYKRSLDELTAKEVWNIVFTVRNANSAAAGKGSAGNRYKALRASRAAKGGRSL